MRLWKYLVIFVVFIICTLLLVQQQNDYELQSKKSVVFIFGLGGSGTRAVTSLFHSWGCTNVSRMNFALDNIFFHNELDDYIYELLTVTHSCDYNLTTDILNTYLKEKIEDTMLKAQEIVHKAQRNHECVVIKAPRLVFLLPIIHKYFPSAKYVQVIRDGRDLAFSENIGQMIDFGRYLLTRIERGAYSVPLQQARFWFLVNLQAKHWQQRVLAKKDFYILNIESLVLKEDEKTYGDLWQTIFETRPPPNLADNTIFKAPIEAPDYNTTRYGKWKYLTDEEDLRRLDYVQKMFHTELYELGYTVDLKKKLQIINV